jgi:hypothetical protein
MMTERGDMVDVLVHHDLGEPGAQDAVQATDQSDAGFLEIVVEHHIIDMAKRIKIGEAAIDRDSDHESNLSR